jgi:hypothetical protein
MKFMVTFAGKPSHFKEAVSRFIQDGSRAPGGSEDVRSMAWSIHGLDTCRNR